ncbi:MAG: hypothetical protein COB62_05520 [Piscirickettsiaceae bacterium]|nr:MAG: hypothetical protein COB62_05520 [Piscirickettsiaceae bacterium]
MSAKAEVVTARGDENSNVTLDTFLKDIQSLETLVVDWDESQQNAMQALKQAHDDLNKEAFVRLIRALKAEPAALAILKEAVSDEVVYAVLRYHEIIKATLHERVEDALETVRPYLDSHGGNVELVEIVQPDTVIIRLLGACDGCPASSLTLTEGVEKAIKEHCPEITTVQKAKGGITAAPVNVNFVSPFANNDDAGWVLACKMDELTEGALKVMTVSDNEVLLSRFGDKVTCYQNACAHMGMPMDMGEVRDGILICPHHAFEYSLESGECLTAPEVQLHTHAVRVINDRVEIKLL